MADCRAIVGVVGSRPRVLQPVGGTKPDLDLIKQAEQVTTLFLEGPARCFARNRGIGTTGAALILLSFPIWELLVWLVFRCKKQRKQPGKVEGDLFAKGQSDNAAGPIRRFNEPGRMGTEPLLCQIQ